MICTLNNTKGRSPARGANLFLPLPRPSETREGRRRRAADLSARLILRPFFRDGNGIVEAIVEWTGRCQDVGMFQDVVGDARAR